MNSKATELYNLADELKGCADNLEWRRQTESVDDDLTGHYEHCITFLRVQADDIIRFADSIRRGNERMTDPRRQTVALSQ